MPVWANLRQRALDLAIAQINRKTDLNIKLESLKPAPSLIQTIASALEAITSQDAINWFASCGYTYLNRFKALSSVLCRVAVRRLGQQSRSSQRQPQPVDLGNIELDQWRPYNRAGQASEQHQRLLHAVVHNYGGAPCGLTFHLGAWVKVKLTQQQEFVIGGYTPPQGSRKYFGALLVGYYGQEGLLFAGRVGTGFSERALATLYEGMQKIKRTSCPFINLPERKPGRWDLGITPAVMKRCTWVEPLLVAQVKFTGWTSDDQLRQPVFLGLRSDKDPKEVVHE